MEHLLEYIRYFAFTIIGGGAGYFIRVLIEHRLAIERNMRSIEVTEFNRAAAKLRAAFAPAQTKLYLSRKAGETNLREFFDNEIPLHGAAVEEFRPFARDGSAYQKAWEEYRKTIYDNDALGDAALRWWSGKTFKGDSAELQNFLDFIAEKINEILHFSAPK